MQPADTLRNGPKIIDTGKQFKQSRVPFIEPHAKAVNGTGAG